MTTASRLLGTGMVHGRLHLSHCYLCKLMLAGGMGLLVSWLLLIKVADRFLSRRFGLYDWYDAFADVINVFLIDIVVGLSVVVAVQMFHPKD